MEAGEREPADPGADEAGRGANWRSCTWHHAPRGAVVQWLGNSAAEHGQWRYGLPVAALCCGIWIDCEHHRASDLLLRDSGRQRPGDDGCEEVHVDAQTADGLRHTGSAGLLVGDDVRQSHKLHHAYYDTLKKNSDGTITMYLQHDNPGGDKESNWLPSPAGPFYLIFRNYAPEPSVTKGLDNIGTFQGPPGVMPVIETAKASAIKP